MQTFMVEVLEVLEGELGCLGPDGLGEARLAQGQDSLIWSDAAFLDSAINFDTLLPCICQAPSHLADHFLDGILLRSTFLKLIVVWAVLCKPVVEHTKCPGVSIKGNKSPRDLAQTAPITDMVQGIISGGADDRLGQLDPECVGVG